jgi:hypothetical protein
MDLHDATTRTRQVARDKRAAGSNVAADALDMVAGRVDALTKVAEAAQEVWQTGDIHTLDEPLAALGHAGVHAEIERLRNALRLAVTVLYCANHGPEVRCSLCEPVFAVVDTLPQTGPPCATGSQ